MNRPLPFLVRAFQVAKSGNCATLNDLKTYLKIEGYTVSEMEHLAGSSLRRQLAALLASSRPPTLPDRQP